MGEDLNVYWSLMGEDSKAYWSLMGKDSMAYWSLMGEDSNVYWSLMGEDLAQANTHPYTQWKRTEHTVPRQHSFIIFIYTETPLNLS